MSSQGDRPRHDRAAGPHGSGLRAADKRVNMAGAHCVCDGEVYGMNEVLRRRVKDSVILYSFGVCRYAWAFSKRMSRGTGCVNCARPGLWGSPSGNRGALPGRETKRQTAFKINSLFLIFLLLKVKNARRHERPDRDISCPMFNCFKINYLNQPKMSELLLFRILSAT